MKRILLMRHAKSSWDHPELGDKERPLNDRGNQAARDMGAWLPQQECHPDVILHSTSARTTQTADLLCSHWGLPNCELDCQAVDSLYLAPPQALLDTLGQLPANTETVLLIAHNPGLEELIAFIDRQYHRFPTAAVADIRYSDGPWDLALSDPRMFLNACRLAQVWRPKEIFDAAKRDAC